MPAPRSKKPKPFQRPSIDLSTPEEGKREWQTVLVTEVSVGDIVADIGRIDDIESRMLVGFESAFGVRLIGPEVSEEFNWNRYQEIPTVFAFTVNRG